MPEPIPEAPQNFGWKDFTGSGRVSERDMQWVYDAFIKHLGQDFWNSRNEYPHPNQAVSVLNFFEGNGRLDDAGIQILEDASATTTSPGDISDGRGLFWLREFLDNPDSATFSTFLRSQLYDDGGAFSPLAMIQMGAEEPDGPWAASIRAIASDGFNDGVVGYDSSVIGQLEDGSNTYSFSLTAENLSAYRSFRLTNVPLALDRRTSDYAVVADGDLWYRSDTDTIRARINGVTRDLLTSAYVPPVTPMTSLDLPYAATSSTPVGPGTTDCFIDIDATAGTRTVNLPSAVTVTSGFTYIIRKVDSSANTIVVDPNGVQTINGATTYTLTKQYETLTIVSNGANWDIWGTYQQPSTGISTKTGAYTAVPTDKVILCNATGGAFTVTLPPVATSEGTYLTIKKIDTSANAVTIDGNASETIDGSLTQALTTAWQYLVVAATASAWFVVGSG